LTTLRHQNFAKEVDVCSSGSGTVPDNSPTDHHAISQSCKLDNSRTGSHCLTENLE